MPREGKRRILAALALRGWTYEDLADKVSQRSYGARNLRDLGVEDDLDADEVDVLARAFEVPAGFFTANLDRIYEDEPTQLERMERDLQRNYNLLVYLGSKVGGSTVGEFAEEFERFEAGEARDAEGEPPALGKA